MSRPPDPDRPHRYVRRLISERSLPGREGDTPSRDWGTCDRCGGSELTTAHLLAPAQRRQPATVARALAAYNQAAERGHARGMLEALTY